MNGPFGETFAGRSTRVYVRATASTRRQPDRRHREPGQRPRPHFVRGQLLFEPNDELSFRLIADYTDRDESCCGAVYLDRATNPQIGNLNEPVPAPSSPPTPTATASSTCCAISASRSPDSAIPTAGSSTSARAAAMTAKPRIGAFRARSSWDFGGATLTSITAYRDYRSGQPGDIDYSAVDILYPRRSRRGSRSSRPSARNCGCRARPSTACSTGWSAAISPTRI